MITRNFTETVAAGIRDNWEKNAYSDYQGDTYLYKDVAEKVIRFGMIFEKHGIGIGSKVALLGKNSRNWAIAYMSTILNGAVIVPILPDFHRDDVMHIVEHSESEVLFISEEYIPGIDVTKLPRVRAMVNLKDFSLVFAKEEGLKEDMANIQEAFDARYPKGFQPADFVLPKVTAEDLVTINYTSGTAGFSKGVVLTHRSFMANLDYAQKNMPLEAGNRILAMLPLAHTFGCAFDFIFPTSLGCHITMLGKIPSPAIIVKAFAEIKPNLIILVPLLMEKIYNGRIKPKIKKPVMKVLLAIPGINSVIRKKIRETLVQTFGGQFREVVMGGAALNPEVERFLKSIGFKFAIGYGMTECGPLISYAGWKYHRNGSSGRPVDTLEMKIDSFDPYQEIGEIMVKGDNVMVEYYKNPEATNATLTEDGWLRTGDLGVFDKDHYIYIKGRSKNMILGPSGQNIYPEEIESRLNNMPGITESVVVDRNHKLVALVHSDPEYMTANQLTKEDLDDLMDKNRISINNKLPKYMQITAMEIFDAEFEKTPKKSIKRYLYK